MSAQERMKDDADWKDGMNVFRLSTRAELIEMNIKLDQVIKVLAMKVQDEESKKSTR